MKRNHHVSLIHVKFFLLRFYLVIIVSTSYQFKFSVILINSYTKQFVQ